MHIRPSFIKAIQTTAIIGWLIILLLISMNFLNMINEVMVRFLWYTGFLMIVLWQKPTFNLEFILLLAFGTAYFFIYIQYRDYTKWTHVKYWLGAPGMYLLGKSFMSSKTFNYYRWIIFSVIFGLFSYASLNMIGYVYDESLGEGTRYTYDFWVGHMINAPLMGTYITGIGTLVIYNFFHLKWKKDFLLKTIHFIALLLSIYFTILLANRTYFLILAIVFFVMMIVELSINWKHALWPMFGLTVTVGIIYYAFHFNILNITDAVQNTLWYRRITRTIDNGLFIDGRFMIYPLVKAQFFDFPLGGYQMDLGGLGYAHNLWLDVLYAVGNYPFYMITAYTLLTLTTLGRLVLSKSVSRDIKILIISVLMGYYLNFMVEPILEGVPYTFFLICLINGATYQYVTVANKRV